MLDDFDASFEPPTAGSQFRAHAPLAWSSLTWPQAAGATPIVTLAHGSDGAVIHGRRLREGGGLPAATCPADRMLYVLDGALAASIAISWDDEPLVAPSGAVLNLPASVESQVYAISDCRLLEVVSPAAAVLPYVSTPCRMTQEEGRGGIVHRLAAPSPGQAGPILRTIALSEGVDALGLAPVEKCVFVESGKVRIEIGRSWRVASAGDCSVVPAGASFRVTGMSASGARYLEISLVGRAPTRTYAAS